MVWTTLFLACGGAERAEPAKPPPAVEAPKLPPAPAPAATPLPVPPAAAGAKVFFVEPVDGAKVKSPVTVKFGIEGMEVKPAGDATPNSGHHHLIIGPVGIPGGQVVPKDEKHLHFGQGQTEASVELAPGTYELTMQFADMNHVSFGEPLATTIHVTVE